MRLSEWVWLGAGILITLVSGYIYFFVPKNGQPNTAMALFFFIGIIFIVIGITKLFFQRKDDKSVLDSIKEQPEEQKTITIPIVESKPNRIDEEINKMLQQTQQTSSPVQNKSIHETNISSHAQQHIQQHAHSRTATRPQNTGTTHTNSFAQAHQYSGPVKTSVGSPNAQHPVVQHIPQSSTNTASRPTIQNTTEHSLKCRKCGNANSGHSNYCHKCGNRLK